MIRIVCLMLNHQANKVFQSCWLQKLMHDNLYGTVYEVDHAVEVSVCCLYLSGFRSICYWARCLLWWGVDVPNISARLHVDGPAYGYSVALRPINWNHCLKTEQQALADFWAGCLNCNGCFDTAITFDYLRRIHCNTAEDAWLEQENACIV